MTGNTKSTIDMALGTATCASFAVPEVGALVGGGLAVGQFVFDIFYPVDFSGSPVDLPASRSDIDRSTAAILTAINDAAFTVHRDNVSTFANDFQEIWKRMQVKPDGISAATWSQVSAKLKVQCDGYFNDATATDSLKNAIRWMEAHNCPNDMVGVYMLAAGLLITYHKTGLNWDINQIVDTYKASVAAWNQQGVPPVKPTMKEMVSTDFHAMALYNEILPDFIAKASTIHDGWQNRWDSRKKQIADSHQQFLAQNTALDPVQQQIKWGAAFAYQYNALTSRLNLTGIASEDDIAKLGQTIDKWRKVKAQLDPFLGGS